MNERGAQNITKIHFIKLIRPCASKGQLLFIAFISFSNSNVRKIDVFIWIKHWAIQTKNNKIYDCKLSRKMECGREDRDILKLSRWIRFHFGFFFLSVYYLQIDIDGNIMHKWERNSQKRTPSKKKFSSIQRKRDTESIEQTKIILMLLKLK